MLTLMLTIAALIAAGTDTPASDVGTWHATRLLATAEDKPGDGGPTPSVKAARKPLEHVVITERGIKGCKSECKVYQRDRTGALANERLPQQNNLDLPNPFTVFDSATAENSGYAKTETSSPQPIPTTSKWNA